MSDLVARVRYALWRKALSPNHLPGARLRVLYWCVLRWYETEICQRCGRPVRLVFHVPDAIWDAITGHGRDPSGECAPGVLCPHCVDDLATAKGLPFLRWTCATDDSVMRG